MSTGIGHDHLVSVSIDNKVGIMGVDRRGGDRGDRRGPVRTHGRAHRAAQRLPVAGADHDGR